MLGALAAGHPNLWVGAALWSCTFNFDSYADRTAGQRVSYTWDTDLELRAEKGSGETEYRIDNYPAHMIPQDSSFGSACQIYLGTDPAWNATTAAPGGTDTELVDIAVDTSGCTAARTLATDFIHQYEQHVHRR
ncbi:hypothetical protein [Nocardia vaccinii]|uniref:hypothetical protein n=1 Tax=Nocardia vaccinii TaxID=1822 RepID=UPI0012F4E59C|nr:hypothetical protein [Nocardia vaccinii]